MDFQIRVFQWVHPGTPIYYTVWKTPTTNSKLAYSVRSWLVRIHYFGVIFKTSSPLEGADRFETCMIVYIITSPPLCQTQRCHSLIRLRRTNPGRAWDGIHKKENQSKLNIEKGILFVWHSYGKVNQDTQNDHLIV